MLCVKATVCRFRWGCCIGAAVSGGTTLTSLCRVGSLEMKMTRIFRACRRDSCRLVVASISGESQRTSHKHWLIFSQARVGILLVVRFLGVQHFFCWLSTLLT